MVTDEHLSPEREDEIQGAAETLQWARDKDAADMMLDLLAEIRRLRAQPGRGLLLRVAEAVQEACAEELSETARMHRSLHPDALKPREWLAAEMRHDVDLAAIVDAIAPETEIERAERAFCDAAERLVRHSYNGPRYFSDAWATLRRAREAAGR